MERWNATLAIGVIALVPPCWMPSAVSGDAGWVFAKPATLMVVLMIADRHEIWNTRGQGLNGVHPRVPLPRIVPRIPQVTHMCDELRSAHLVAGVQLIGKDALHEGEHPRSGAHVGVGHTAIAELRSGAHVRDSNERPRPVGAAATEASIAAWWPPAREDCRARQTVVDEAALVVERPRGQGRKHHSVEEAWRDPRAGLRGIWRLAHVAHGVRGEGTRSALGEPIRVAAESHLRRHRSSRNPRDTHLTGGSRCGEVDAGDFAIAQPEGEPRRDGEGRVEMGAGRSVEVSELVRAQPKVEWSKYNAPAAAHAIAECSIREIVGPLEDADPVARRRSRHS
mmetsp:Transcript_13812/g.44203  ORF Transcript_13812/g.44203 Transcript_13812/m.44203 type:complete len:338 (+) Transcript_13812:665-1678(+)